MGSAGGSLRDFALAGAIAMAMLTLFLSYELGYIDMLLGPMEVYIHENVSGKQDVIIPHIEPEVNITPPPVPENLSFLETEAFEGVNMERETHGLDALEWNSDLAYVARMYSQDMIDRDFFSHDDPEGRSHSDRLNAKGIYYFNASAENLAMISYIMSYTYHARTGEIVNKTYKSLKEVARSAVEGWMNSTGHRENILYPYFDEAGMGAAYGPDNEKLSLIHI